MTVFHGGTSCCQILHRLRCGCILTLLEKGLLAQRMLRDVFVPLITDILFVQDLLLLVAIDDGFTGHSFGCATVSALTRWSLLL